MSFYRKTGLSLPLFLERGERRLRGERIGHRDGDKLGGMKAVVDGLLWLKRGNTNHHALQDLGIDVHDIALVSRLLGIT